MYTLAMPTSATSREAMKETGRPGQKQHSAVVLYGHRPLHGQRQSSLLRRAPPWRWPRGVRGTTGRRAR